MFKFMGFFVLGEGSVALAAPTGIFDLIWQAFLLFCYCMIAFTYMQQKRKEIQKDGE